MISLDTIEQTIIELEAKDTTFANCERLAPLYIVRDHIKGYTEAEQVALDVRGKSEFLRAINGKSPEAVLPILDELVEAVAVLHPKMYQSFIDKIKDVDK